MKSIRFNSVNRVRCFVVMIAGLALCASFSLLDRSLAPSFLTAPEIQNVPVNTVNSFSYVHFDKDRTGRPLWGISFDAMATENGSAGIFKTAMRRSLHVQGLRLHCYYYNGDTSAGLPDQTHSTLLTQAMGALNGDLFGFGYSEPDDPFCSLQLGVDFRNLTALYIQGFQYEKDLDGICQLQIKSGIAQTMDHTPGLVLRGHVRVSDANGTVLECNHVVWDMKNEWLTAKGLYALRRNGVAVTGRDICMDMNLNEISVSQNQPGDEKETFSCYAKAPSF